MRLTDLDRTIAALAVPALGALLVAPMLMLADSAIIGHWSTQALAGLALAQTIFATIVGLCIFLAYATTASVSRAIGGGHRHEALASGMDAIWLAVIIGLATVIIATPAAGFLIGLFHPPADVGVEGTTYLRIVMLGLPGILVVQAATGVVRGLQDTVTPLIVTLAGAIANVPLSLALVHGAGWGIAGAAVGTLICELGMAIALASVVIKTALAEDVSLRPRLAGITATWSASVPLFVRTISLRIAIIALSAASLTLGTAQLAAHQIVTSLWLFISNGLDSIAIAAQALTGKHLGAGDAVMVRRTMRRMLQWGVAGGTLAALLMLAAALILPGLFTPDPLVQSGIRWTLLAVVICQPIGGLVYVLDGVLMGAGDTVYLAWLMWWNLIGFLPVLWAVVTWGPSGDAGLVGVWLTWGLWMMGMRAAGLWWRQRGDAWMRLGA